MLKCAIINNDRGKDVKKHCLVKNGYFAPYHNLRRDGCRQDYSVDGTLSFFL